MVRTFTPKHRRDFHYQQKLQKTKIIPKNLFTIYPTIETIECSSEDLVIIAFEKIFKHVKIIKLKMEENAGMEEIDMLSNSIRDKVVSCDATCLSDSKPVYPIERYFPNVRKLTVRDQMMNL